MWVFVLIRVSDVAQSGNVLSPGNQYQVGERIPRNPPPRASPAGLQDSPGQPNHFISVFYTSSYQPFLNRKEEMMFSQSGLFLNDTSPCLDSFQESLFRDLFCMLGGERKRVFEKSHCDFTNVFCNSPPHPSPRHTLRHTSGLNLLLAYFYSQIFKHIYHEALGIMLNTSSVNQNWERSMSRLYIITLLI